MDSNSHRSFENHQPNIGLLRFRSAPSSLLMSCTDAAAKGSSGECLETEQLISRFMNSDSFSPSFHDFEDKSVAAVTAAGYGGGSGLPPHYPRQGSTEGSYGSTAADRRRQLRPVDSISGLTRQNSSPAGLFSQFSVQNGFGAGRGVGEYRSGNGELSPSTKKLRSQLSLSSLGMLSQISEIGDESVEDGFHQIPSWNDFTGGNVMKREQEDDHHANMFSSSQNGDVGGRVRVLAHHLSLPKTAAEMGAVERLLQYQDSVPCKIRAKRGCATHPRSIAERVRRTRISERMRKLQDLVPNMDKQTNTSDMLDLAVDYIKDLQRQYKNLSDNQANCKCLNRQNTISHRTV